MIKIYKFVRRSCWLMLFSLFAVHEAFAAADASDAPQTLFDYFVAGGKLMWAILLCSVVGLAFAVERLLAFRKQKLFDATAYDDLLNAARNNDLVSARETAMKSDTSMGRVLAGLLSCPANSRAEMETLLEDAGARELWELQRNAKPLGIISNIAPLLGLLGTVLGIIRAFRDVAMQADAMGNAPILATGIYEALITTAAGLSVAIPAYLLYHYFRGRADAAIKSIEEHALELIAVIAQPGSGQFSPAETGADSLKPGIQRAVSASAEIQPAGIEAVEGETADESA